MKRFFTVLMTVFAMFCMGACADTEIEKTNDITIQALNANKEMVDIAVPYDPERIAVLDMPALDILDNLGSIGVMMDRLRDLEEMYKKDLLDNKKSIKGDREVSYDD